MIQRENALLQLRLILMEILAYQVSSQQVYPLIGPQGYVLHRWQEYMMPIWLQKFMLLTMGMMTNG
jgi:hypothetical protein